VIQETKKTDKDILVLDAGSLLFFKNIDHSLSSAKKKEALLNAQLIVQTFNLMGCDAAGIGADDLRLGPKDFALVHKTAQFPVVSANVVSKDGQKLSVPSLVKNAGGLRWGIFSLMNANPSSAPPSKGWRVVDPVTAGIQVLKELEGKTDIVILLAAMSLDELRALLPQLPGVTIALAGGEPDGLVRPLQVGQTTVVCSPSFGKYLGVLHLSLKDPKAPFADEARITELERELALVERKVKQGASGSSQEEKKRIEAELQEVKKGNIYRNELIALSADVREEPGVKRFIEDFRAQQRQSGKGCQ
jgi:2',3'-cyclic-nucleotide 2'-phosphodiesterase (5'-nucleotidase family)